MKKVGLMNGLEVKTGRVLSGIPALENMMEMGSGIITIRCDDIRWLSNLVSQIISRNHSSGGRILYLHWIDYHKRYWSIDYEQLVDSGKSNGADVASMLDDVVFQRAFSRDNTEVGSNWEMLVNEGPFSLMILDSIPDLFEDSKEGRVPMTYSIGRFVQLCVRNGCVGIALDRAKRPVHNYLAHVSSVIIEVEVGAELDISLLKHPCLADGLSFYPKHGQWTLRKWM